MSSTGLGILLALGAAIALNGSYLVQHAGSPKAIAVDARKPVATFVSLLRSPLWFVGGVLGMAGWALHLGAMSQAPLSLVQAFVAGGLALAVPMAAIGLRQKLVRAEVQALALMVAALVALSVGLSGDAGKHGFPPAALAAWIAALGFGAGLLVWRAPSSKRPLALGLAGGLLYGAADLGFKAVAVGHTLLSPWLPLALIATLGAFFAFQRGLQADRPLVVIGAMTGATNVSSILGAFVVLGDPLGRTPGLAALHALAFALVVASAWRLAPVQARLAG
jgi:hypothetical protein